MKTTRPFPARFCVALSGLLAVAGGVVEGQEPAHFVVCGRADNDLVRVAEACGLRMTRVDSAEAAIAAATRGTGALILADNYPERATSIPPAVLEAAATKGIRLFVEFPDSLPDLQFNDPVDLKLERIVVQSEAFRPALPPMRIAIINACRLIPADVASPHLVAAKVAGVDTAVFGLKDTPTYPVLFEHPRGDILVATTRLSHFVTGRSMPQDAWAAIWHMILRWVQPDSDVPPLTWRATVRPTYGADEALNSDVEREALRRAAAWVTRSRILRHPDWPQESLDWALTYNTVRSKPADDWPVGDGSLGMLEGYSSTIHLDGGQPMRYAVRNDCMSEVAMALACDADVHSNRQSAAIATNLLNYLLLTSPLAQGPRGDPTSPSYGLVGWSLDYPNKYWGDDNARALLGMMASSALLRSTQWHEQMARCIVANFRTTGPRGYREACITDEDLQHKGWPWYSDHDSPHLSPHYQSWLWACYLLAYQNTGYEPYRTKSRHGITLLMRAYPKDWNWVLHSAQIERARALLPLAWLVRVDDTPQHRLWLRQIADDLLSAQDSCGAIGETLGGTSTGISTNSEYGTGEVTLIQQTGDTISDCLYTCNFALIGLHEAAAATGDPYYADAEQKLARYLCRIQIQSEAHPQLDGAWYRGFDFRRWEYWASNADWEWGAWCTESGWGTPWIATTLALRHRNTSLWDLVSQVPLTDALTRYQASMLTRSEPAAPSK